jgi:hypothetical protein
MDALRAVMTCIQRETAGLDVDRRDGGLQDRGAVEPALVGAGLGLREHGEQARRRGDPGAQLVHTIGRERLERGA